MSLAIVWAMLFMRWLICSHRWCWWSVITSSESSIKQWNKNLVEKRERKIKGCLPRAQATSVIVWAQFPFVAHLQPHFVLLSQLGSRKCGCLWWSRGGDGSRWVSISVEEVYVHPLNVDHLFWQLPVSDWHIEELSISMLRLLYCSQHPKDKSAIYFNVIIMYCNLNLIFR